MSMRFGCQSLALPSLLPATPTHLLPALMTSHVFSVQNSPSVAYSMLTAL